ncbi:Chemotaxis protein methyltransferase Cher2 [Stieleria neptunia]|uniref:protein-glutamate O-methyltransferase n=1 Tax=Stieleria neptunia TaxID=2527979 RepID=A0A518HPH4_9BACT|nr:protein-glutamate O-methyltransferase CheR [Stieleria neptunia]QDV42743.1 Chemotaxis protein methyltransferase Cher2 [Stieleria neptunia]
MTLPTADFAFLRTLVADHSGQRLASRHVGMLEQRLAPIAGTAGLKDVSSLVRQLRRGDDSALSSQVVEAVAVNETSFFRDASAFETLAKRVLPQFVAENRNRKQLRIWCAACSSGQEPYSIAMLLEDHFSHLHDWDIRITASDLCEKMIQRARLGTFSSLEVSRGLPAAQLLRHFDRRGAAWQAKPALRERIEFHRINLARPWPYLGPFDIVLARNVLLYFDQPTKQDILKRLRGAMRPDGYLFIGAAETLIGLCVPYQRKEIDDTVYYRPTAI